MIGLFIIIDNISKKIDLFNDEVISISSSIQNFKDISKVFTDFSQGFKIPRSLANENTFKHWHDSSVSNGFDHRTTYTAYIEVNNETFKQGVISLTGATDTDYAIVFYGNSVNINAKFGELKLKDLDYSSISHLYTELLVKSFVEGSGVPFDLGYPLFAKNSNKYEYLTANAYDVTVNPITWNDLFPAVKVTDILSFIQSLTGIELLFDTSLNDVFNNLFLYYKNNENSEIYSEETKILLDYISAGSGFQPWVIDVVNDKITFPVITTSHHHRQVINVTPTNNTLKYSIIVKKNGVVFSRFDNLIGYNEIELFDNYRDGGEFTYYFKTESTNTLDFFTYVEFRLGGTIFGFNDIVCNTLTASSNQTMNLVAPDLKLIDFVTGLTKMFNLAIIPNSASSFNLIPLDQWYVNGNTYDLTKYVISEIEINKPKLYKSINFSYEKSELATNSFFNKTFNRGYDYGDLKYTDTNTKESENYDIKLPFESPIFESYGILTTATFVDKNLQPYTPKPVFLFDNGYISTGASPIKFGAYNLNLYRKFSNEIEIGGIWYSLTFGAEISASRLSTNLNGLYETYYTNYINSLYDIKTRVLNLTIRYTREISLNDSIIIKGKKYKINNIKTNLLNLTQELELI